MYVVIFVNIVMIVRCISMVSAVYVDIMSLNTWNILYREETMVAAERHLTLGLCVDAGEHDMARVKDILAGWWPYVCSGWGCTSS